jgi:biopolymer transport protein ExbD
MPKFKLPARSPRVDMTPMVDLFSLLLTFFMLTSTFRQADVTEVKIPNSISEKQAPDKNIMTIYIDTASRVYFNIDNGPDSSTHYRADIINEVGKYYNMKFSDKEVTDFKKGGAIGMPIKNLPKFLDSETSKDEKKILQSGMPIDSADNRPPDLWFWVNSSRKINSKCEVEIKGDAGADYKVVKKVLDILQVNKIDKFNLTTTVVKETVSSKDIKD